MKIVQKQINYIQFKNQNLGALIPIVKKWLDYNVLYLEKTRGERPSLYNERPLIGMLGAAAYATGGIALEEFSTRKRQKPSRDSFGRCDLKIWTSPDDYGFRVEAKLVRIKLPQTAKRDTLLTSASIMRTECDRIIRGLDKARRDAGTLKSRKRERRIGICFACLKVPKNEDNEAIPESFERLMSCLSAKQGKWHFSMAWLVVDKDLRIARGSSSYFGVIILLREVKKRS